MKILSIFIDMLSADRLNICNSDTKITNMDRLLSFLGGTVYTKTYTPAPDTPRSSACMWTGLYPKKNGCNCRIKWPKDDINYSVDNIWKAFYDKKYKVNVFIDRCSLELGLIPLCGEENIFCGCISDWYNNLIIEENSFTFLYLQDLHMILDECHYSEQGFVEGEAFQTQIVEEFINHFGADIFDYILMYSDHGFRSAENSEKHVLSKSRVKTFMYLRKKGQSELVFDKELRSNLDIMPTICEMIEFKNDNEVNGISLLSTEGHKYVFIEDMHNFSIEINQAVEHWCVVLPDESMHWIDCNGIWENEKSQYFFDEVEYKKLLSHYMTDVDKNMHMYKTMQRYNNYLSKKDRGINYSNGVCEYVSVFTSNKLEDLHGRIVLYGAGKVGKSFYNILKKMNKCSIAGWIDINYEQIGKIDCFDIKGLNAFNQLQFDTILICIQDEKNASQIRKMLIQLGFDDIDIIWIEPIISRAPREDNIYE